MTESPNASDITKLQGGRAPEDRQCRYVFGHGRHCRSWAIRGHDYCHHHGRWEECRVDGPIEVPLMEDPSSVTLVLSQTARALGWGHIPPDNGRAIIAACRVAQAGFNHQLALAKFRLKLHRLGLNPSDFLPASAAATAASIEPIASTETPAESPAPDATEADLDHLNAAEDPLTASSLTASSLTTGAPFKPSVGLSGSAADPAPYSLHPTPCPPPNPLDDIPPARRAKSACDACAAALGQGADESLVDCKHCPAAIAGNLRPLTYPDPRNPPETPHQPRPRLREGQPAFRDLKTKWEAALERAGRKRADMRFRRSGEDREDFLAARARPFDEYLYTHPTSPPPPIPPRPISS